MTEALAEPRRRRDRMQRLRPIGRTLRIDILAEREPLVSAKSGTGNRTNAQPKAAARRSTRLCADRSQRKPSARCSGAALHSQSALWPLVVRSLTRLNERSGPKACQAKDCVDANIRQRMRQQRRPATRRPAARASVAGCRAHCLRKKHKAGTGGGGAATCASALQHTRAVQQRGGPAMFALCACVRARARVPAGSP